MESDKAIKISIAEGSLTIGGAEKLADLRARFEKEAASEQDKRELRSQWANFAKEVRIRLGTVLKSQRVSVLLGAGASRSAGGPVLANIPIGVEDSLVDDGLKDGKVTLWLAAFYAACAKNGAEAPTTAEEIGKRRKDPNRKPIAANYEHVLFVLHVWGEALADPDSRLTGLTDSEEGIEHEAVETARKRLVRALVDLCELPRGKAGEDDKSESLRTHRDFVQRLLTRPVNLRRVGVFTVNYDTLLEQAADAEGAMLVDGFVGNVERVFRPESYDYDFYFPAETTEGPIHRLDRVLQLYKLHGSINWRSVEQSWTNPYGIEAREAPVADAGAVVIYPTPAKHGDALAMPYAELFRRFAASVAAPQSVLITIGYGFPDEHVNAIIRQALAIPSFTLIVVDPSPDSAFVKSLREQEDQRVWIFSGDLGYFERFVAIAMPDLRESEIERRVVETYRALSREAPERT
jgi:SIR2-like domain